MHKTAEPLLNETASRVRLSEGALDKIVAELVKSVPHLRLVFLFGSFAKESGNAASDLDLAIRAKQALAPSLLMQLSRKLSAIMSLPVEVVDLGSSTTVFAFEIVHTGRLIYAAHEPEAEAFMSLCMSRYVDLEEARTEILQDIYERGCIYTKNR